MNNRMVLILAAAVIAVVVLVMSNWMQPSRSHHAAYPARSATYATIGATRRLQLQARKEK